MIADLRTERLRRGRSIRAMAAEIGVTPRVLQAAEAGTVPRPENAIRIADAYGLDVIEQWAPAPREAA